MTSLGRGLKFTGNMGIKIMRLWKPYSSRNDALENAVQKQDAVYIAGITDLLLDDVLRGNAYLTKWSTKRIRLLGPPVLWETEWSFNTQGIMPEILNGEYRMVLREQAGKYVFQMYEELMDKAFCIIEEYLFDFGEQQIP